MLSPVLEQRMEDLHKRIVLERLRKFNSCHVPSGSAGGQFCETKGGGNGAHYIPIGEATAQLKGKPTGTRISAVLSDGTRGTVVATSRFSHRFVKDGEASSTPIASKPTTATTTKPTAITVVPPLPSVAPGAFGGKIKVTGEAPSSFGNAVSTKLESIPAEYRVVPLQTIHVQSSRLAPGNPNNVQYSHVNGSFHPENAVAGSIRVSSYVPPGGASRGPAAVADTAHHEYGHAVDYHLGMAGSYRSDRADFREAFNQEYKKVLDSHKTETYFVKFSGTPHHEAFAELFKVASGGKSRYGNKVMQKYFPESLTVLKTAVTGGSK